MNRKINLRLRSCPAAVALAGTLLAAPLPAQQRCPPAAAGPADSLITGGWDAYHRGDMGSAAVSFAAALDRCPRAAGAETGLGYVALRKGWPAAATFTAALQDDSTSVDAWTGLALAAERAGLKDSAAAAARRAVQLDRGAADARAVLDRITPDWDRPPPRSIRAATLQLPARIGPGRFEVRAGGRWQPLYVRGVNFGVALPGHFPAEFPTDSALYAGWIDTLAAMHANAVRLYTILPPEFYRALAGWNRRHPAQQVWLIQGVWAELPPDSDFDRPDWLDQFAGETRRAVDAVHGAIAVAPHPGHASGRYDADVSQWTLAYIIGREWEPYAVEAYDAAHPGLGSYRGRFLAADSATAMDLWLARRCDDALKYEFDRYHALHPIAYTNWPTLDPLHHPSEASGAEERAWRERAGRPVLAPRHEYENDLVSLDATTTRATGANPAGWFASYHAYPYYPDFMLHDSAYQTARSPEGRSNYFGYLRELVRYHRHIPVLIAEYGVPSSRGIAHFQPQGWNHGGHDERDMAAIDARLTREIRQAGAAGGVIFSWLDEWFKRNWVVIDLEQPAEDVPFWHSPMDAEQHYGIMGEYAGSPGAAPRLGGDPQRWRDLAPVHPVGGATGLIHSLGMGGDRAYFYLAVTLDPAAASALWDSLGIQLAIDTDRRLTGQHRLPRTGVSSDIGFEFVLDLPSPAAGALRILPDYNPYAALADPGIGDDRGRFYHRPATIVDRDDGRFDSMFVVTNRARFARDGRFFPARGYDRGRLRFGTEDSTTLADWYLDRGAGLLEVRLPWTLLNVTDPVAHMVVFDHDSTGPFGLEETDGFDAGVVLYRKADSAVTAAFPILDQGRWSARRFAGWSWPLPSRNMPDSHARLKPVYDSLRTLWETDR